MEDLISVIVPVYNVGPYLSKCVESIQRQTYSNLEIILVDDGSTDNGKTLCDVLQNKDKRIKVVHKQNGGITSARKAGVSIAGGRYLGFVDGDDWIEENMYEALCRIMKRHSAQVVLSGMYRDNEEGIYAKWAPAQMDAGCYQKNSDTYGICTKLFSGGGQTVSGSLNNKLFEADLLKRNLNEVDDRIHGFADDTVCTFPCLLEADTVFITDEAYYHGFERAGSATHSRNEHWFEQLNYVFFRLRDVFEQHVCREILLQQLQQYMANNALAGLQQMFPDLKMQRFFWNETKDKKNVILYGAGQVGQSFYYQFQKSKFYHVVLWVDQNPQQYRQSGFPVDRPERISETEYDEIIIALNDKSAAEDVQIRLLNAGICREKIRWEKPLSLYEYICI